MNMEDKPKFESSRWLVCVQALFLLACLGAGYLVWAALSKDHIAGCGYGSGCQYVLQSRWAYWLDVPVSLPALMVYLLLFLTTVLLPRASSLDQQRGSWMIIVCLSMVVMGSALWFIGVQAFILRTYCKFCCLIHGCGMTASAICLFNIPISADNTLSLLWSSGSKTPGMPKKGVFQIMGIGLLGILILIAGQLLLPTRVNWVQEIKPSSQEKTLAVNKTGKENGNNRSLTPSARLVSPGLLSLFQERVLLKLDELPLLGKPDAPHIIVVLTDYACPHCRLLHQILLQTQQRLSNQLAIVLLPMPASTNCNSYVPANLPSNSNSCEYARLSLAVWRAQQMAYHDFEAWMYSAFKPKPVEQAGEYAVRLVGELKLKESLTNSWIDQQISINCYLHHLTSQATGKPTLPQIIIGNAVSVGSIDSVQYLFVLIEKYLGLKLQSP